MNMITKRIAAFIMAACFAAAPLTGCGDKKNDNSSKRLEKLEKENQKLKDEISDLKGDDEDSRNEDDEKDDKKDKNDKKDKDDKKDSDKKDTSDKSNDKDKDDKHGFLGGLFGDDEDEDDDWMPDGSVPDIVIDSETEDNNKENDSVNPFYPFQVGTGEPIINDVPLQDNNGNYIPNETGIYAMWIDVSGNVNKYFEGDMIKVTLKVKDNAPDGDYTVRISPDLSNIAGVGVKPSGIHNGTIRVNNGKVEPQNMDSETGDFIFYADNVACKQGDTIECNINIKNNTGLAAFCIWFYYDSNALEYINAEAVGDYKNIAKKTEIGAQSRS